MFDIGVGEIALMSYYDGTTANARIYRNGQTYSSTSSLVEKYYEANSVKTSTLGDLLGSSMEGFFYMIEFHQGTGYVDTDYYTTSCSDFILVNSASISCSKCSNIYSQCMSPIEFATHDAEATPCTDYGCSMGCSVTGCLVCSNAFQTCDDSFILDDYCHSDCNGCTDLRQTDCSSCTDPLKTVSTITSQCECATGSYDSSGTCITCPTECTACSSAASCSSCADSNAELSGGACVCSSGFFDSGGGVCQGKQLHSMCFRLCRVQ